MLFVTSLFLATAAMAETELKGSASELANYLATVPKLVTVVGEAEVKIQADRAIINLGVTTENKSLQEALRLNQDVRNRIVKRLKDADIGPDRLQASKFSSTPKHSIFSDKARSYRVENTLKVTVLDEKEFQAVANVVDNLSEVRYLGIDFEHSDKEGLKTKVLNQALSNAAAKKKVYEEQLGVKLVPRRFTEGTIPQGYGLPGRRTEPQTATFTGIMTDPSFKVAVRALEQEGGEPSFGALVFTAQVAVEYALESK